MKSLVSQLGLFSARLPWGAMYTIFLIPVICTYWDIRYQERLILLKNEAKANIQAITFKI